MPTPVAGTPGLFAWHDGVDASLAGTANATNLTTGTVADARLPVTAQAATLSATYVPQTQTVNNGISAPKITREIADPNRTASKWREVFNSGSFNTHPDPVMFIGWNADRAAGGGDLAETAIYMGFEGDYWDTATTRTSEWYVGVIRADGSGPQFRPFAFTAARDSNLDLAASVQIDIGNNANGSARSKFNVAGNGISFFAVTPTGATFSSGQVNVIGATPTLMAGDGTGAGDAQLSMNAKATAKASINFLSASAAKWQFWTGAGSTFLATYDLANAKYHVIYDPGTTNDLATARFFCTPQLNGTQPVTATAGSAVALPATPQGYFQMKDAGGVIRKVPYYV